MRLRSLAGWLFVLTLAACTGGAPPPATVTATPIPFYTPVPNALPSVTPIPTATPFALPGRLLISRQDASLVVMDMDSRTEHVLATLTGQLGGVAWSPDGRQIVYAQVSTKSGAVLPVSELYLSNAEGLNPRLLVGPDSENANATDPSWSPDGKSVYYTYSAFYYNADGTLKGSALEIRAVDVASGAVRTVLSGAAQPVLSPDGETLAFLKTDEATLLTGIWLAQADGSEARPLLPSNIFIEMYGVRFVPDAPALIFSASQNTQGRAPAGLGWLDTLLGVQVAEAHGLPADIWRVNFDGAGLTQLTMLGEDQPHAALSPDGRWIAVLGIRGLYVLDAAGTSIGRVSELGGHGIVSWGP